MFRSKVTRIENVGDNLKLAKALSDISHDALTREYESFCAVIEKKELLDAAYDLIRAAKDPTHEEAELSEIKAKMVRHYHDLKAITIALCDANIDVDDDEQKQLYRGHLASIYTEVNKNLPEYEQLSFAYYQLKADVCGIVNKIKFIQFTETVNHVNATNSVVEERRPCNIM